MKQKTERRIKAGLIVVLILFGLLCSKETNAQENQIPKRPIEIKKAQLTLDMEPLFGAGFTSAWKLNHFTSAGIGFHFVGIKYILSNGSFKYGNFFIELAKFTVFWRYYLSPGTYFKTGPFLSGGKFSDNETKNSNVIAGNSASIYTGFKKLKFGINIQVGSVFRTYNSEQKTQFVMGYLSPVIQLYF